MAGDTQKKGFGVVVLAPKNLADSVKNVYVEQIKAGTIFVVETDNAFELKLTGQTSEQQLIWVSSCTQNNII